MSRVSPPAVKGTRRVASRSAKCVTSLDMINVSGREGRGCRAFVYIGDWKAVTLAVASVCVRVCVCMCVLCE